MFDRRSVLMGLGLSAVAPAAFARTAFSPDDAPTAEDAALVEALDAAFLESAHRSPETLTQLGIKDRYGELDDYTAGEAEAALALSERQLADIEARFGQAALSDQGRLSLRLFRDGVEQQREQLRWRRHQYLVSTNGSVLGSIPVMLINAHKVDSADDARAYVSRLEAVERVMTEVAEDFAARAADGLKPPAFVYAPVVRDARNVITGAPFGDGEDTPLWADFQAKVNALSIPEGEKTELLGNGRAALTGPFKRGYDRLIGEVERVGATQERSDGAWALPNSAAYYASQLKFYNSTDDTADWIHETGLSEVARLHAEMEVIKAQVGFEGTLQEFFVVLREDPQYQYPNTAEGREQFLSDARVYVAQAMETAPQWFSQLPQAALEVRAVEEWRQDTAPVAFYNPPSADGSRPGIYYVNLSDMTQVSKIQNEAITYHEAAPGHHFQIARAQEQQGLPMFRKHGFYGAYIEGWALYTEKLAKEMGFYGDPYSDFGRLSLELWRAIRMVVDTGVHTRRWTREQAIQYFTDNSMMSALNIQREVERYICWPGQATSYKVGQLKVLGLRDEARAALGDRFDIKGFHEVVLAAGAVPLGVLEERVRGWAAA
ncbi:DUF885 family protein [Brevundimonas staleyi]|uniref:DUF885 domain-containing protein n=1 Tax=Brevundimonas staleyi TaxID=74326 RepID=A0ABW0FQE0_9CAUL